MAFWFRWKSADGDEGPRIGPFAHRREAEAALLTQVRTAAAALEHGTGQAGTWTSAGALYRDDLDDRFLGRYVIEEDERAAEDAPTTP